MGLDERLQRPVAVKLLTASAVGDDRSAARFRREARTAARLNHPRIVTVYDFGISDDRCFLTMELVKGSSLAHELRRRGPLPPARVAALAAQAAEGLAEAHRQGVVHRDIKPSNLLLDEDGMVKVADFGIARSPDTDSTACTTGPGPITGTSLYLAPEAALGEQAGPAADVYALGCSLYELLTGTPPFTGEHPVAVLCQHVETPAVSPCRLRPGLSDAFGDFVLRMLAKDPEQRPDAREVADRFGTVEGRSTAGTTTRLTWAVAPAAAKKSPTAGDTAPLRNTVSAPVAADAAHSPWRERRTLALAGGVTTAAALAAAVIVLVAPLTDGAGDSHAPGSRPTSTAATTPGLGLIGPGRHARNTHGRASTVSRSRRTGSHHSPAGKPVAVDAPGTDSGHAGKPTAPATTPPVAGTPTASPSHPADPPTTPPSASPSPSTSSSAPTTTPSPAGTTAVRPARSV